jgi:lysophospholipase L1-like esterase
MNIEKEIKSAFQSPKQLNKLDHGDSIIQLGSCFSEHISQRLVHSGFDVLSNPFGVVFHPLPLANQILWALDHNLYEDQIVSKDDVFLHYQASSFIYAMSEDKLKSIFLSKLSNLKEKLQTAKVIFITLGSAHVYKHSEYGFVANCHQQNKNLFEKQLSEIDHLETVWSDVLSKLKAFNPQLQVVFTVSPVRYKRDGWIENNQSKARLIELCNRSNNIAFYFPSYEVVIDMLRDYRYFEKDGVHPNEQAVDFVWSLFQDWFFSESTTKTIQEINKLRIRSEHKILYPESIIATKFETETKALVQEFLKKNPKVIW